MQTGPGLNSRTRQICCNGDVKTLPDYFSSFHPRPTFSLMWEEPPRPDSPLLQSVSAFYVGLLPEAAVHQRALAEEVSWHWAQPALSSPGLGKAELCAVQGIQAISKLS